MTKKFAILFTLLFFSCASVGLHHINRVSRIKLSSGQMLWLLFDAPGSSEAVNELNASTIIDAATKIAQDNLHEWIELSFEDPTVYDAGANILPYLLLVEKAAQFVPDGGYISLLAKGPDMSVSDTIALTKAQESVFQTGFTMSLVTQNLRGWPQNLTVRSNDPGHEHYLDLLKERKWLLKNSDFISMGDLVLPSRLFSTKRLRFKPSPRWSREVVAKLQNMIIALNEMEKRQLASFSNFVGQKTIVQYPVARYEKPINYFHEIIDLSIVYDFLMQNKKNTFAKAPVLDVLLTLLGQDAPEIMIVILNDNGANQLVSVLHKMGIVAEENLIEKEEFIKGPYNSL